MKAAWFLIASSFLACTSVHAQGAVGRALLPALDFDRIHTVLTERCTAAAPETVLALSEAIKTWRAQHYVPQRLIQAYMLADLSTAKGDTDTTRAKETLKTIQDASVDKFTRESAAWDAEKMRGYCTQYPAELLKPEMNFAQLQKQQKARFDAMREQAQQQKQPPVEPQK
jgi:hypothetical protein